MKGYKIFIKEEGVPGWIGPYYDSQEDWVIKAGEIIEAYDLDPRIEEPCGEGVNFWVNRKSADASFLTNWALTTHIVMYEIEAIEEEEGDVVRPVYNDLLSERPKVGDLSKRADKARARKVKLLKRVKYWKRKK